MKKVKLHEIKDFKIQSFITNDKLIKENMQLVSASCAPTEADTCGPTMGVTCDGC